MAPAVLCGPCRVSPPRRGSATGPVDVMPRRPGPEGLPGFGACRPSRASTVGPAQGAGFTYAPALPGRPGRPRAAICGDRAEEATPKPRAPTAERGRGSTSDRQLLCASLRGGPSLRAERTFIRAMAKLRGAVRGAGPGPSSCLPRNEQGPAVATGGGRRARRRTRAKPGEPRQAGADPGPRPERNPDGPPRPETKDPGRRDRGSQRRLTARLSG